MKDSEKLARAIKWLKDRYLKSEDKLVADIVMIEDLKSIVRKLDIDEQLIKSNYPTEGVRLIAEERIEQIVKHGFDPKRDAEFYKDNELLDAAEFALRPFGTYTEWPKSWGSDFKNKILKKNDRERAIVAGALIAAHLDLLNNQ